MAGTGNALQFALTVMVIGAVAITLSIASISIGWHLGRDVYLTAKRRSLPVRRFSVWWRYRVIHWITWRWLSSDYFQPWVDQEADRRKRRRSELN